MTEQKGEIRIQQVTNCWPPKIPVGQNWLQWKLIKDGGSEAQGHENVLINDGQEFMKLLRAYFRYAVSDGTVYGCLRITSAYGPIVTKAAKPESNPECFKIFAGIETDANELVFVNDLPNNRTLVVFDGCVLGRCMNER